jgi:hypothetical protein
VLGVQGLAVEELIEIKEVAGLETLDDTAQLLGRHLAQRVHADLDVGLVGIAAQQVQDDGLFDQLILGEVELDLPAPAERPDVDDVLAIFAEAELREAKVVDNVSRAARTRSSACSGVIDSVRLKSRSAE